MLYQLLDHEYEPWCLIRVISGEFAENSWRKYFDKFSLEHGPYDYVGWYNENYLSKIEQVIVEEVNC
jgi:hypothetical protein